VRAAISATQATSRVLDVGRDVQAQAFQRGTVHGSSNHENLTVDGVQESGLWVGDQYVQGPDCTLVVSEPRLPCFKFGAAMGFAQAVRLMVQSGWCGAYFAVLQPGTLGAGDTLTCKPGPREVSVAELFRARARA
jgi:MOSC domain-containing protein YiiM